MATQQAWDDFNALKSSIQFIEGECSNCVKDTTNKLEVLINTIVADPARAAEVIALADQHPHWTSTHLLELYNKFLAIRATIIAQGL